MQFTVHVEDIYNMLNDIYDAKMPFYLCSFARIHIGYFTKLSTLVVLIFRYIFRILYETYESSFHFVYFLVWMLIQSLISGQIYTLVILMNFSEKNLRGMRVGGWRNIIGSLRSYVTILIFNLNIVFILRASSLILYSLKYPVRSPRFGKICHSSLLTMYNAEEQSVFLYFIIHSIIHSIMTSKIGASTESKFLLVQLHQVYNNTWRCTVLPNF